MIGAHLTLDRFLPESLIENEYKLAVKYNSAGGGPKILLGDTADKMKDVPMTLHIYRATSMTFPKGRIGEVYPNFATAKQEDRYKQFKWYGQMIYAPANAEEILKAGYGTNCLSHSIDKHHSNVETDLK